MNLRMKLLTNQSLDSVFDHFLHFDVMNFEEFAQLLRNHRFAHCRWTQQTNSNGLKIKNFTNNRFCELNLARTYTHKLTSF